MRLEHANLATSDVAGLSAFFAQFFGFELVDQRGRDAFVVMRNTDGFVLTLMKSKKTDPDRYPETFHLGLYCDTPDQVIAKHAELAAAGYSPGDVQTPNRDGPVTTFYCTSPGNIVIEVATPPAWLNTPALQRA